VRRAIGSTRARLTLVSTVVLALALVLADAALIASLAYAQRADTDRLLAAQAELVASGIEDTNGVSSLGTDVAGQSSEGIAVDSVLVSGGAVVAESPGQPVPRQTVLAVAEAALRGGTALADATDSHGTPHRLYARNLDGGRVLVVGRSVAELSANLERTAGLLGLVSIALVVVAGGVSFWLAGRALRGVRESFESLRRFTADASHELRAPLALLRNEIDVTLQRERSAAVYRQSLIGLGLEVDHLARMTDHLLLLARADAKALTPMREPFDVADALHEGAARWSRTASEAGVALAVSAPESGSVGAEPSLVRRVIDNLVDNAVRHSPRGGTVTLSGSHVEGGWWIAVADQGPGVAPEHRSRLFTRFARSDAARSRDAGGAGLGLALSAAIVAAHGGRLELAPETGSGATFRFFLPDS
jgi:signal transduction histidine kinase